MAKCTEFLAIIWPETIKVGPFYSKKFSQGIRRFYEMFSKLSVPSKTSDSDWGKLYWMQPRGTDSLLECRREVFWNSSYFQYSSTISPPRSLPSNHMIYAWTTHSYITMVDPPKYTMTLSLSSVMPRLWLNELPIIG